MTRNSFRKTSREDALMSVGLVSSKVSLFENLSKNFNSSSKQISHVSKQINALESKPKRSSTVRTPDVRPGTDYSDYTEKLSNNKNSSVQMFDQRKNHSLVEYSDGINKDHQEDYSNAVSRTTPNITRTETVIIQRHPGETIGIELEWNDSSQTENYGYWVVKSVQPNGPASRATPHKLKEGDEVISIDGRVLQKPEDGSDFVYSLLKYLPLKFEMTTRQISARTETTSPFSYRSQSPASKISNEWKPYENQYVQPFNNKSPSTRLSASIEERMKLAGYCKMKLHVMNFKSDNHGFEAKRDVTNSFKEMFMVTSVNEHSPFNGVIQPNDLIYSLNGQPVYGKSVTSLDELYERFNMTNNGQVDIEIWRKIGRINPTFFQKAGQFSVKPKFSSLSPQQKNKTETTDRPKTPDDPSVFAQTPIKMRFSSKTTFEGARPSKSPLPPSEPPQYEINEKGKLVPTSGYLTSTSGEDDDDDDDEEEDENEEEDDYLGCATSDNSEEHDNKQSGNSRRKRTPVKSGPIDLDEFDYDANDGVLYEDLNNEIFSNSKERLNNSRPSSRASSSSRQSIQKENDTPIARDRRRSDSQNSLGSSGRRSSTPPQSIYQTKENRSPSPRKVSRSPSPGPTYQDQKHVSGSPSFSSRVSPSAAVSPFTSKSQSPGRSTSPLARRSSPLSRSLDNDLPGISSKSPTILSPKIRDDQEILPTTDLDSICLGLAELDEEPKYDRSNALISEYSRPLEVITEMSNSEVSSVARHGDTPNLFRSNPSSSDSNKLIGFGKAVSPLDHGRPSPEKIYDMGSSVLVENIPDTPMLDVMLDQIKTLSCHRVETYKGVFGLGITCTLVDKFPIIAELTERGSVAKCRNVNVGDILVSVNDKCLLGHSESEISHVLRVTPRGLVTLQICQPSRDMRERIFPRLQALYRRHSPDGLDSQDVMREDREQSFSPPKSLGQVGSDYYERCRLAAHHFIEVKDNVIEREPKMYPSTGLDDHPIQSSSSSSMKSLPNEPPHLVGLNYRGMQGSSVSGYRQTKQIPVSEFVKNILTGSSEHRNEEEKILDIEVEKGSVTGFFIYGGRSSEEGNLPIRVKRMYQGSSGEKMGLVLKEQDEILEVNDVCFRHLTHHEAFTYLRSLPPGPMRMKIRRRQKI